MLVAPVLLFCGAGLLTFVHGQVSEPPTCDTCGKIATPIDDAPEFGVPPDDARSHMLAA